MKLPIDIGNQIEMFVDNKLVNQTQNLTFSLSTPQYCDTAIIMDKPWELPGSGIYCCVFFWNDHYHLYYRGVANETRADTDNNQYLCYAKSSDGIHWDKPALNLVEFQGSRHNNIIMAGRHCHNFAVFLDTNPKCKPEEKIKGISGYAPDGLFVYGSEDGISFHRLSNEAAVKEGILDSHNVALYSPTQNIYRIYSRCWLKADGSSITSINPDDYAAGMRSIQYNSSNDYIHWDLPEPNKYSGDIRLEHLYTSATTICPGAEHYYLAFPMRFIPDRICKLTRYSSGVSDNVFMSSRDGMNWDRRFLDSFIRADTDYKNWTMRNHCVAQGIVQVSDENFSLFVTRHYAWDDCRIDRYVVRKHGFASLYANEQTGYFETNPLKFSGHNLFANFATAAPGHIRFAIYNPLLNQAYKGFDFDDCEVIFGNQLNHLVRFSGGDLQKIVGKTIILKGEIRLANLYAIQFA